MTESSKPGASKPSTSKKATRNDGPTATNTDKVDTMTFQTTVGGPASDELGGAAATTEIITPSASEASASASASASETSVSETPASAAPAPRPRIRFGAIAWGLIVCGIAAAVLLVVGSPSSRADFTNWVGTLTPGGFALIGVLVLGALILLWGLLGVLRRLQRRHAQQP